jgi:hypothetical protein
VCDINRLGVVITGGITQQETILPFRILYSRVLADAWMTAPNTNPMFGGDTPLAYLIKGALPGMIRVRQRLDAAEDSGQRGVPCWIACVLAALCTGPPML